MIKLNKKVDCKNVMRFIYLRNYYKYITDDLIKYNIKIRFHADYYTLTEFVDALAIQSKPKLYYYD